MLPKLRIGHRVQRWLACLFTAMLMAAMALAGVAIIRTARSHDRYDRTVASFKPASGLERVELHKPLRAGRDDPPVDSEHAVVAGVLRYAPVVANGGRHRLIALTFDDGPSPYTPEIVSTLVALRVPATFFVVGQQLRYFSAGLRDELRHGFEVGDHTQNHAWLIRLAGVGQYWQIDDAVTAMERFGAQRPALFRPPYGAYDAQTLAALRRLGMLMVLWSIDPRDWRRPGPAAIVQDVLSAARPGGVVELHDGGGDRSQTVAALPAIISGLRQRHYQLVTLSQLLQADPPSPRQPLPHLGPA